MAPPRRRGIDLHDAQVDDFNLVEKESNIVLSSQHDVVFTPNAVIAAAGQVRYPVGSPIVLNYIGIAG